MGFYYNAIFFDRNSRAYKYRTIKNMERFESYITGKFDVLYINYYDRKTRKFLFRKYMNNFNSNTQQLQYDQSGDVSQ